MKVKRWWPSESQHLPLTLICSFVFHFYFNIFFLTRRKVWLYKSMTNMIDTVAVQSLLLQFCDVAYRGKILYGTFPCWVVLASSPRYSLYF